MEVRLGSSQATVDWSAILLQDRWDQVDRPDVRQEIERVAERLAPP
jgi:hypothetical protein